MDRGLHWRRQPQPGPEHVLQRAGKQDHQALDDDDHVAADMGHHEGDLGAALVEHAEQDRRRHDAGRMRAAHQRHRDADEARPGDEIELQAVLVAHHRVERHHAGERARDHHGDDDDARLADAGIARRLGAVALGADLVAEPRAPDQHPDQKGADQRQQEGDVERRGPHREADRLQHPVELGQLPASRKVRVCGAIWPAGLSGPTSR
jgi:hypothetical protein